MTDIENSIVATKQGFENSFSSGDFYNKQTQDEHHLKNILDFLPLKADMKILDLGTGSGYLSFPIAKKNPTISIIGLDIVEKALEVNRFKAKKENIRNIRFVSYNGIDFPFANNEFDMVISRYALHHFPDIQKSIFEVSRIIKQGGFFFISDPTPNANDASRFVDEYMQLKKDGHIKFYTKDEWLQICGKYGLQFKKSFDSTIRFPRKKDTAYGFDELLKKHDKKIVEGYELEMVGDEIYITEQVNNILFYKRL
ncbi:MAG: methyltransferase domain-containing protein [Treponemataceae bacterium]|nr:methyltransferase domain-containing protein [Treponemataceae bacterium]